jgi:hypothetical protein
MGATPLSGDYEPEYEWLSVIRSVAATVPSYEQFTSLGLDTSDESIPDIAKLILRPPPPGPPPAIGTLSLVLNPDGIGGRLTVLPPGSEGGGAS